MALMEAPAIIVGVILIRLFSKNEVHSTKISSLIKHSFTNGSVITGSLIIGFIASDQQALGKPLQQICSKGFSLFLLDMEL
jgi:hypothetical protein